MFQKKGNDNGGYGFGDGLDIELVFDQRIDVAAEFVDLLMLQMWFLLCLLY